MPFNPGNMVPRLGDILSSIGRMRYGVSTSEKEKLARSGSLPGAPVDNTAGQETADRYASGYLFGKQWPNLAPAIQPLVNMVKTSDLAGFGGSSPELQSWASHGVQRGALDAQQPAPALEETKKKKSQPGGLADVIANMVFRR